MKNGLVISIVNQKGGVGKTTTAINLASYLSELGHKVLLIDLDPQANTTSGVGIVPSEVTSTIYDAIVDANALPNCLYPTPFDNLHIIPANEDLAGAEVELTTMDRRESVLKRGLGDLKSIYDYIVIDCPPSLGLLTVNALVFSQKVIIPVQCEYFALEGLVGLIRTMTLIKDHHNPDLSIMGILLTMFDRRTTLNRLVVENAKSHFKHLIFDTIIPRNIRLTEAPSHGLPIALYKPSSTGALAYTNLVQEVLHRAQYQ